MMKKQTHKEMTEKNLKIKISHLCKSFGAKKVLQGIDLEITKGESLVIIGGSGTGKSVLLKCIIGLLESDSGSIQIDGQEMMGAGEAEYDEVREKISMLFQGSALFDSLTVWENVAFRLLQQKGLSRKKAKEIAVAKLASVRLGERVADLYPSELSGGMQRRVALARAIATKPDIIFFDEPTAGLDPITSGVINGLIRECVSELGATAITITHDIASARHIADQVAMIHQGKIVWQGAVADLDHSKNAFVDQFIHGMPKGPITEDANA